MTAQTTTEIKLVSLELESARLIRTEKCETDDMREFVFKFSGSADESWKCYLKQYCNGLIDAIKRIDPLNKNDHQYQHLSGTKYEWLPDDLAITWKNSDCKEIKNFRDIANFCGDKLIIKSTEEDLLSVYVLKNIISYVDYYFKNDESTEKAREQTIIDKINTSCKA